VLDRPVMAHIVDLCTRQGFDELIANLHYFPDTIRDYFGDRLEYRYEEELLGTAGGVRNVRDFFGDELVVVIWGAALTASGLGGSELRERKRRQVDGPGRDRRRLPRRRRRRTARRDRLSGPRREAARDRDRRDPRPRRHRGELAPTLVARELCQRCFHLGQ